MAIFDRVGGRSNWPGWSSSTKTAVDRGYAFENRCKQNPGNGRRATRRNLGWIHIDGPVSMAGLRDTDPRAISVLRSEIKASRLVLLGSVVALIFQRRSVRQYKRTTRA